MNGLVHFEILAEDPERAKHFYDQVFGWRFEDYSEYTGSPYWGVVTREEGGDGINGGLMPREGPAAPANASPAGFVCTMLVDDYNETREKILGLGGVEVTPKYALPGMAWQGYFLDTEGNRFGIHQADENAK